MNPVLTPYPQGYIIQEEILSSSSTTSYYDMQPTHLPAGTYTATINDGCAAPVVVTAYLKGVYNYRDFGYTTENTCSGLKVTPAGNMTLEGEPIATFFRLVSGPAGYDKTVVTLGGYYIFSSPGTYILGILNYNSASGNVIKQDTIVYTAPPLNLDPYATSAYVCVGETVGNISVKAVNGVAPYTYELWNGDNTTRLQGPQTSSGRVVYTYGTSGSTYTVRIADNCGNSFSQQVTVTNLETAKIVFAEANPVCYDGDIKLRCLTLGETSYNWTGPNGYISTEQNPVITSADSSKSGWYKVSVNAEFCGEPVKDSIYISVYNLINIDNPEQANQILQICPKSSLTLGEAVTEGSGTYTYKWQYSSDGVSWNTSSTATPTFTVIGPESTTASFSYKYIKRTVTDAICGEFVENYQLNVTPCYIPVNPDLMNLGIGNPIKKTKK